MKRLFTSLCALLVSLTALTARAQTAAQNLFVADASTGNIVEITPDGASSTFAFGLSGPGSLAFDRTGNLFVVENSAGSLLKFTPDGMRSTFALGLANPIGLAIDSAGNLFVVESGTGSIIKFTPDGVRSTFASGLDGPWALAIDSAGNLFVTDSLDIVGPGHAHIYKFTPDGARTTFASNRRRVGRRHVTARSSRRHSRLLSPLSLAFDSKGNLFVAEGGDIDFLGTTIYKFTPGGKRRTFVKPNTICVGTGLAFDSADNLFVVDACSGNIVKFTPEGARSTFAAAPFTDGPVFLAFQPGQH